VQVRIFHDGTIVTTFGRVIDCPVKADPGRARSARVYGHPKGRRRLQERRSRGTAVSVSRIPARNAAPVPSIARIFLRYSTRMKNFQEKVGFIWSVADLLRGDYKQSEYGNVILPLTVLRRLDCVLEPTKRKVLDRVKARPARADETMKDLMLCQAAGPVGVTRCRDGTRHERGERGGSTQALAPG
jgi:hypothetical protein